MNKHSIGPLQFITKAVIQKLQKLQTVKHCKTIGYYGITELQKFVHFFKS